MYTASFKDDIQDFAPHDSKWMPSHGVLVSNELHDLKLHWATGELDHGSSKQQGAQLNSSFGGFLTFLVLAVVAFHVFLGILIFKSDLCAGQGSDSMKGFSFMNRFREKYRKSSVGAKPPTPRCP